MKTSLPTVVIVVAALLGGAAHLRAQRGRAVEPMAPVTARALAPVDLTGVWVSVVTEDWRAQVEPEGKSQHPAVPLSPAGLSRVNARNPVKDETSAEACRGYGAPGVMRAPGRIRINWDNDNTLRIDTEAGTQTRLLRFAPAAAPAAPTWQGESRAEWQMAGSRRVAGSASSSGTLKAITHHLKPGYLQKNGVAYGPGAVLTEYFARTVEPGGDTWLVLTAIVDDPQFLNTPFMRRSHFKKLPATSPWQPQACVAQ